MPKPEKVFPTHSSVIKALSKTGNELGKHLKQQMHLKNFTLLSLEWLGALIVARHSKYILTHLDIEESQVKLWRRYRVRLNRGCGKEFNWTYPVELL